MFSADCKQFFFIVALAACLAVPLLTHTIPTLQFSPLSLHQQQFHPVPILITPHIYPTSPPDTKGQLSMANPPNPQILGLWEDTRAPWRNLHRNGENMQTPNRQLAKARIEPGSLALWES